MLEHCVYDTNNSSTHKSNGSSSKKSKSSSIKNKKELPPLNAKEAVAAEASPSPRFAKHIEADDTPGQLRVCSVTQVVPINFKAEKFPSFSMNEFEEMGAHHE